MSTPLGHIFDLIIETPDDPYEFLALKVFELAFTDVRSGNGRKEPAEEWMQSEASLPLAALLFKERVWIYRNWALAGCPDPEQARQPGMRDLITREVSLMEDYEQLASQCVMVVDCKECGIAPQMRFESKKLYLKCPKCGKKTGPHFFVIEAADEWEDINE